MNWSSSEDRVESRWMGLSSREMSTPPRMDRMLSSVSVVSAQHFDRNKAMSMGCKVKEQSERLRKLCILFGG